MVNTEKFSKRLQQILDYYDLSAAAFADAIDVGRSSISHILSGRNKPSLDFIMKIVQTYPEVEIYWLLNGKGNFPATTEAEKPKEKPVAAAPVTPPQTPASPAPVSSASTALSSSTGKQIRKIVIFYEDGSFEAFEN